MLCQVHNIRMLASLASSALATKRAHELLPPRSKFGIGGKEGSRDLAVTKCVVKDVHPAGASHLQQQLLNQWVVPRLHLQPNCMYLLVFSNVDSIPIGPRALVFASGASAADIEVPVQMSDKAAPPVRCPS